MIDRNDSIADKPAPGSRSATSKRLSQRSLKMLVYTLLLALTSWVYAAPGGGGPPPATTSLSCSTTVAGDVVINEIQTFANFIEFYVIQESDINNWSVYVDANRIVTLGNGDCEVNNTTTKDNESSGASSTTWPAGTFITCDFNTNPSNNEVLLTQSDMSVIDYLSYGTPNPRPVWSVPDACGSKFPDHNASNKDIARLPDGSGDWQDNGTDNTKGASNSGGSSSVAHYAISLPLGNPGITCEANAVTITAHDAGHAAIVPSSGTQITLSTSIATDGWSLKSGNGTFTAPNQYTFDGVESSVQLWLRQTTATSSPHIDIDVTDGTATDQDGDAIEDPNAEFADTGFRFFDANSGTPESINHQIAGKPSNIAPDNQSLQLRAIKTNSTIQACEAAIQGTSAIELAYECNNPTSCTGTDLVTLSAAESKTIARNNNGSVSNYTSVNMLFDANGVAPFSFYYNDAGNIRLHARKTLSADDSRDPPTAAATLAGSSNPFSVRPFGFYMDNLGTASDATSANVFARAGNDFITSLTAKIWVSGEDSDSNGIADNHDDLSDNLTTANFGNETTAQTVLLSHNKVLPTGSGTSDGTLAGDTTRNAGGVSSHFSSGVASNVTLNWNEVGIIDLSTALNNYLNSGQNINTSKSNVGRFIPHHFDLSDNTPDFLPSCNVFTYLDQPFYYGTAPTLTVTAKAKSGSITQNYGGGISGANGFWKLNSLMTRSFLDGHMTPPSATLSVISSGTITLADENDFDGLGTLSQTSGINGDEFIYNKNAIELPFDADVDITYEAATLTDSDSTCYDPDADLSCDAYVVTISNSTSVATELRYGRMVLFDAYGSELSDLNLPLTLEYWGDLGGGESAYIASSDDTCTLLDSSDIIFSDYQGNLNVGETSASSISVSNGKGKLTLTAPGDGNDGEVCVEYDLTGSASGNNQPWLQDSWSCASKTSNNPLANARFGIYPGNSRQIYMREQY